MPSKRVLKSRMISFRISEQEFEILRALYPQHGARNLSDFARMALMRQLQQADQPLAALARVAPEQDAAESGRRLEKIEEELARLTDAVTLLVARGGAAGPPVTAAAAMHATA